MNGALGDLDPAQRQAEQEHTLSSPLRNYGVPARVLFTGMDLVYGRRRTWAKFRVLELIARVPYQAWEQVSYVAITHTASRPGLARRIYDRVTESRCQQDNEQWHLLILEEIIQDSGQHLGLVRFRLLPQAVAFVYYQLSWLLYVLSPAWSYRLNADFEDHAEHQYMSFAAEHPELEHEPYRTSFAGEYGCYESQADLVRQIGYDERMHKEESLARMREPRFH